MNALADPDVKSSVTIAHPQARSQKFVMGGGCLGVLGAEPPALEKFAFFCKNNFILGLF